MCWSARPHHVETTSPVDSWQTLWFNPQNKHPWLCTFRKRSRMPALNSPWILLVCSRGRDTETQHWLLYVELGLVFFFWLLQLGHPPLQLQTYFQGCDFGSRRCQLVLEVFTEKPLDVCSFEKSAECFDVFVGERSSALGRRLINYCEKMFWRRQTHRRSGIKHGFLIQNPTNTCLCFYQRLCCW